MKEEQLVQILGEAMRVYGIELKNKVSLGPFKDLLTKDQANVKISLKHDTYLDVKPARSRAKKVEEQKVATEEPLEIPVAETETFETEEKEEAVEEPKTVKSRRRRKA